jgi:hypothetical protein
MPRIVVLDSGVFAAHPHIAPHVGDRLTFGPAIASDGSPVETEAGQDALGHGTCATAAILERVPDATIHVIRLFGTSHRCTTTALMAGLRAALEARPNVINLSAGSTEPAIAEDMAAIVSEAAGLGVRIVAPAAWHGLPAWPGCLPGVEGVLIDATLARHAPERREQPGHAYWYASPLPRPIEGVSPAANLAGVSVACAHVTAHLALGLSTT